MRKLLATLTALALLVTFATPAQAAPKYTVYQKTLANFSGDTSALTPQQRAQVRAAVEANPDAEKFICTGIRFESQPMSVNIMVRKRAKAACDYAKELNPALSTWFQNKPTKARSYAGKVLLTVKTLDEPAQNISLSSYDPAVVSSTALERVDEYLTRMSQSEAVKVVLKAGPKVTDDQVATERRRIAKSATFWGELYDFEPIAFVYSGADAEWMVGELNKLGNFFHDDLILNDYWKKTGECMQSLAVHTPVQPYYINCQRDEYAQDRMSPIAAHEFAHLPITAKFQNQPGGFFSQTPVWMNEGTAEFFGIALTEQARATGMAYWHRLHLNGGGKVQLTTRSSSGVELRDLLSNITVAETVELMSVLESMSGLASNAPYSLGHWAAELMIANGGMEKFVSFLNGMNSTTDWKKSFENNYGMSVTDFYKSMVPYLNWIGETYQVR